MKTTLAVLLFASLAFNSHALRCYTCVGSSEEECRRQGSTSCPQYADACSTIRGDNTVMKSCSYRAFCDTAQGSSSGVNMECCYDDNCNGRNNNFGWGHGMRTSAGVVTSCNVGLVAAVLLRTAFSLL